MHTDNDSSMLNQSFIFNIHGRRFLAGGTGLILVIALSGWFWHPANWLFVIVGPMFIIGLWDLYFTSNTILRNFPFFGHFRYTFLRISPEIHQYFIESNIDGRPFNKIQRAMINKRADKKLETHPFGTEYNVYRESYEWAPHSIFPKKVPTNPPRIRIGGPACRQPYEAATLNISAMSYGSLSAQAIQALNKGARAGEFYQNTGEGGLSHHHEVAGADLVWEIGSGYFGCRGSNGEFDEQLFQKTATKENVKMIEIKLSQGAKPGHGGVLPASKNTPEIAKIRNIEPYIKVESPSFHKTFSDAAGLLNFVQHLRNLSDGKPVGFKLCVGDQLEFVDICQAMHETEIQPDFITVDGGEGGTGAAPPEFSDSVGMPLEEALVFVVDTLNGFDLRKNIQIIASGKIVSGFDMIKVFALGANICNSARGMMFALGCIQALKCDTDECPTGITTHKPHLTRGLVVSQKALRVANFQKETVLAAMELMAAIGCDSFQDIQRKHIFKRIDKQSVKCFAEIFPDVEMGEYLNKKSSL